MSKNRKSFIEVLGETAPKRPGNILPPLVRGNGSTDTLPKVTRSLAQAESAHMDAVVRRQRRPIFNPSSHYLLEDTKSRAGSSYKQKEYVVVTREEFSDNSHIAMTAQRSR